MELNGALAVDVVSVDADERRLEVAEGVADAVVESGEVRADVRDDDVVLRRDIASSAGGVGIATLARADVVRGALRLVLALRLVFRLALRLVLREGEPWGSVIGTEV